MARWNHHCAQSRDILQCWHVCSSGVDSAGSQTFVGPSQGTPHAGAWTTDGALSMGVHTRQALAAGPVAGTASTTQGLESTAGFFLEEMQVPVPSGCSDSAPMPGASRQQTQ